MDLGLRFEEEANREIKSGNNNFIKILIFQFVNVLKLLLPNSANYRNIC